MDRHKQTFREEAAELLGDLENVLLELEESPADPDLVDRAFRSLHTIKGSGAMVGFDSVAAIAHEVESFFQLARDGEAEIDKRVVALTLSTCDQIREMIKEEFEDDEDAFKASTNEIIKIFQELVREKNGSSSTGPAPAEAKSKGGKDNFNSVTSYRIHFKPRPHLFQTGSNPLLLFNELRELGECVIVARTAEIPPLENLEPENCYISWDAVLTTDQDVNAIRDVFIFVEDDCDLTIQEIEGAVEISDGADYKRIGEILLDRGAAIAGKISIIEEIARQTNLLALNASAAEEMASTSEELASQAEQLQTTIGFFKLEAGEGSRKTVKAAPVRKRNGDAGKTFAVAMNETPAKRGKSKGNGTSLIRPEISRIDLSEDADALDSEFERY